MYDKREVRRRVLLSPLSQVRLHSEELCLYSLSSVLWFTADARSDTRMQQRVLFSRGSSDKTVMHTMH